MPQFVLASAPTPDQPTDNPAFIFDERATPPFTVVGFRKSKLVGLDGGADVPLTQAPVSPTPVLSVTDAPGSAANASSRRLTLTGAAVGVTTLQAKKAGSDTAELEVAVKTTKEVSVSFIRIIDNNNQKSARDDKGITTLLGVANFVFTPQTAVLFKLKNIQSAVVPLDFSRGVPFQDDFDVDPKALPPNLKRFDTPRNPLPCIADQKPGPEGCRVDPHAFDNISDSKLRRNVEILDIWSSIFGHFDPDAQVNVFLVQKLDVPMGPGNIPSVGAFTLSQSIILPDSASSLSFAHEMGHTFLGPSHTKGDVKNLMDATPGRNVKLRKAQINKINP